MSKETTQIQKKVALMLGLVFWLAVSYLLLATLWQPEVYARLATWRLVSCGLGVLIALFFVSISGQELYRLVRTGNDDALAD